MECAGLAITGCCTLLRFIEDERMMWKKIGGNDISVNDDLVKVLENFHKYPKKDQRKIIAMCKEIATMNVSTINTAINTAGVSVADDQKDQ